MKILVTGGAGFIGSHIVDKYIQAGHQVVVVDDLSTGKKSNINPKAKFYQTDISYTKFTTYTSLQDIFYIQKPDIVNHHAAQISVPISVKNPIKDAQINILGLVNVLQCCVRFGVKKIIFASSGGSVYGQAKQIPTTEQSEFNPSSIYAMNKIVGQKYLQLYKKMYNLEYIILRYSNVYGPRQDAFGESGVVAIFIQKVLNSQQLTLNTFNSMPLGMIRDYVYVRDIAAVNLLALSHIKCNTAYNISNAIQTTTSTIAHTICSILNNFVQITYAEPRPGDLRCSVLNNTKLYKEIQWKPEYNLKTGLTQTINYFKNNCDKLD